MDQYQQIAQPSSYIKPAYSGEELTFGVSYPQGGDETHHHNSYYHQSK